MAMVRPVCVPKIVAALLRRWGVGASRRRYQRRRSAAPRHQIRKAMSATMESDALRFGAPFGWANWNLLSGAVAGRVK